MPSPTLLRPPPHPEYPLLPFSIFIPSSLTEHVHARHKPGSNETSRAKRRQPVESINSALGSRGSGRSARPPNRQVPLSLPTPRLQLRLHSLAFRLLLGLGLGLGARRHLLPLGSLLTPALTILDHLVVSHCPTRSSIRLSWIYNRSHSWHFLTLLFLCFSFLSLSRSIIPVHIRRTLAAMSVLDHERFPSHETSRSRVSRNPVPKRYVP